MKPSRRAFTLIELLVVIAIIGILASLLFPAVGGAIDAARKAQAKNDVVQVATAITAYETEYGRLPLPTKTTVDNELIQVLIGVSGNTNNTRQIPFLEVQAAKKGKSGTNDSGFVDPWGNLYQIRMDENYDNTLEPFTAGNLNSSGSTNISGLRKKVAVFNFSSSSANSKDSNHFRKAVRSWE